MAEPSGRPGAPPDITSTAQQTTSIGGGYAFERKHTTGDYHVASVDGLIDALDQAEPGETVHILSGASIDISHENIFVPNDVTLTSTRGVSGSEPGRIYQTVWQGGMTIDGVLSGVEIQGIFPDYTQESDIPSDAGENIGVETGPGGVVENCEIYETGMAGVGIDNNDGRVTHCYIHDLNVDSNTRGFGVKTDGTIAPEHRPLIDNCRFKNCRSAIAEFSGGGFYAVDNIVEADGSNYSIDGAAFVVNNDAGANPLFTIEYNTFYEDTDWSIYVSGPIAGDTIHHNWSWVDDKENAFSPAIRSSSTIDVHTNHFGDFEPRHGIGHWRR